MAVRRYVARRALISPAALLAGERVAPYCVVFIEDHVKFFGIPQLTQFIVVIGLGPALVAVFQPTPFGLAEIIKNFPLGGDVILDALHRGGGKVSTQRNTSRQNDT
jgi:hypothetical protein